MDILRKKLTDGFKSGKLQFKTQSEIIRALRLSPSYKKSVRAEISRLVKEGIILKDNNGRYGTPENMGAFKARVKANPQGYAFLIPEGKAERENDYFVPKKHINDALDGDTVLAVPMRGTADEARIVKIIERGKKFVIGVFQTDRRACYVIPDDRAFDSDVYIPFSLCGNAEDGDKVVAEITSYPKGKAVGGKVAEVLGKDGDFFVEEEAILRTYGYENSFPDYVEETAQKVAAERVELTGRRDLRNILTITIDGVDTRDIDDAVSLEVINGKYRLGVQIADVSHYVKPNGCIDKEAYHRGTSV
ncbi:MAG: RNB domain-containing ribonuclease, partial [Clostridia bacterium]|nr:RNB domain-containing ribonuclease [Clostridia bacterium]